MKFNYTFFGLDPHPGLFYLLTLPAGQTVLMVDILFQAIMISNSKTIGSNYHSFLKIEKGPKVLPLF